MKKSILSLFLLGFLAIPFTSSAYFDSSLKLGARGEAVSELQDFLQDQGFLTGSVDGKFGLGTLKAVRAFQSANDLKVDGYFGMGSRSKAQSILADLTKESDEEEISETGSVAPLSSVSGCLSTTGFSSTTGQKCDGAPSSPVTDSATQAKLDALTAQLKMQQDALNQIAQNTAPVALPVTPNTPATTETLKFLSSPEGTNIPSGNGNFIAIGMKGASKTMSCTNCIWVGTNKPTRITFEYVNPSTLQNLSPSQADALPHKTIEISDFSTEHFLTFSSDSKISNDNFDRSLIISNLNLDKSLIYVWRVTATDESGVSISQKDTWSSSIDTPWNISQYVKPIN